MSMSDTAEYWWDIKRKNPYIPPFTHLKGLECGHYHKIESKKLTQIDCPACLQKIETIPELKNKMNQSQEAIRLKKIKTDFGNCVCGKKLIIRMNKQTKEQFLGCQGFPTCKKTKHLKTRANEQDKPK